MKLDGRSVLVTGADGFIGSHLVAQLLEENAKVRALCFYNSESRLGWLDDILTDTLANVDVRLGDIRDADFVRRLVEGTDIVFHLAALIAIPFSYESPRSFIATNTEGTLNVLEAVRQAETGMMINTSTSEVYGTARTVPITEDHALQAQSPYSASKIAADKLCEAYALSFDTPVVTIRPFNTYGPRQSLRAVIPTILAQLLSGVTQVQLGNLDAIRDFTYVTDTVDAFLRMANADLAPGTVVHLGSGQAVSIRELVTLCCEVVGRTGEPQTVSERLRPQQSEVGVLQSDPSLANEILDWKATTTLRDGLARVADWLEPRVTSKQAARYHR